MWEKREVRALTVWALMIILLLGLFLIKPNTTGFASLNTDTCRQQAQAYCMNKNYGSTPQTRTDTNLCNGRNSKAMFYSSGGNHKFVYNTGDTTYNSANHICVVCTDGRTKAFNKNSGEHCSTF